MADKTIGELDPVKESPIGGLPEILGLYDDTLIPVEQQGKPGRMTGRQWADFGRESAKGFVQAAVDAAERTGKDLERVEELRDSIEIYHDALHQAVEDAEGSANRAKESEYAAAEKAREAAESRTKAREWAEGDTDHSSKYWAGVSQAEAERASVPAVEGVYNIILTDRVTNQRYALLAENGRLVLLEVSELLEATNILLIDRTSGLSYAPAVENGRLLIEEAV